MQVVVMILGRFPTQMDDDIDARTTLLAPVVAQNDAIREAVQAHRGRFPPDVDPDTGEAIEAPELDRTPRAEAAHAAVL